MRALALIVLLLASGCALLASPASPPARSESAFRLQPGSNAVESADLEFTDEAHGRRLASTVWWPAGAIGPVPLVVQAHGFLSSRSGGAYIARDLASRGYVVVAATHPTTTLLAPGGAKIEDVIRQPGDVSVLIDRMLDDRWSEAPHPAVDPSRIAVMGHSLGGLTATLAAFHPRLRDRRIAAAISIAGPMEMLERSFFATADVPFLMIAGSSDVIVDYRKNAFVTLDRVSDATLVLIAGASHTGFDDAMTGLPRVLDNPDTMACWVLARTLHLDAAREKLAGLAEEGDGVTMDDRIAAPCREAPPAVAMDAAWQHRITILAVAAFLDSRFAPDPAERARAQHYLTIGMAHDLPDVSVQTTARAG